MANGQNQVLCLKTLDEPNKKIYIFFGKKLVLPQIKQSWSILTFHKIEPSLRSLPEFCQTSTGSDRFSTSTLTRPSPEPRDSVLGYVPRRNSDLCTPFFASPDGRIIIVLPKRVHTHTGTAGQMHPRKEKNWKS